MKFLWSLQIAMTVKKRSIRLLRQEFALISTVGYNWAECFQWKVWNQGHLETRAPAKTCLKLDLLALQWPSLCPAKKTQMGEFPIPQFLESRYPFLSETQPKASSWKQMEAAITVRFILYLTFLSGFNWTFSAFFIIFDLERPPHQFSRYKIITNNVVSPKLFGYNDP